MFYRRPPWGSRWWRRRKPQAGIAAAGLVAVAVVGWQVVDSPRPRTTSVVAGTTPPTTAAPVTAPPT
ncbi:MAG TPA: hypothetical protein VG455_08590, partial [Acidimicrobiales bacterium]|nr:hypothetical protein [Acidimicrobiales bacterium]